MRALLGDPNQATVRAGYSEAYDRQGLTRFTDLYGGNRGASISLSRTRAQHRPRAAGRVVAGPAVADQPPVSAAVQSGSDLSDRGRREPRRQPQRVRAGHQDRARPATGRSASRARSRRTWRSRSATSATAATTSGRSTTTANEQHAARDPRREPGRQRLHERVQAGDGRTSRPTTRPASRTAPARSPTSARAPARSPLPIYLAYLNGSTRRRQPRRVHQRHEHVGELRPSPAGSRRRTRTRTAAAGDLDGNLTRRTQAAGGSATRRTSSSSTPTSTTPTSPTAARSASTTRCSSSCAAACRRASRPTSTTSTRSRAARSSTASASAARGPTSRDRQSHRPPRDQVAGGLDAAVRPRPALRQRREPARSTRWSAAGASPASAACRRTVQDLGNVRLVGMTREGAPEDVQVLPQAEPVDRHRRDVDAAGRHHPQHAARVQHEQHDARRLLDQPRRAAKAATSRPANSASLHPGQGRRLRAAERAAARAVVQRGSTSASRSSSASAARGTFEVRFDLLNLFDNPNYNPAGAAGTTRRPEQPRRSSRPRAPTPTRATPTIRAAASDS